LKAEDNRNDGMSQKPSVPSGSPGVFAERILVWMLDFVLYALPSIDIFSGSNMKKIPFSLCFLFDPNLSHIAYDTSDYISVNSA